MLNIEWAEEEIKLAKEETDDYRKTHLDKALKAYIKLFKEGDAGYSFGETTKILERLIDKKPLVPIKDLPDTWKKVYEDDNYTDYVCIRMPSLMKSVTKDGTTYDDIGRTYCVNIKTGDVLRLRLGKELINSLYPIEMPYYPPIGYFKVYYENLEEPEGITFKYLIKPDGKKVILNWSYTYDKASYEWKECKNEQLSTKNAQKQSKEGLQEQ